MSNYGHDAPEAVAQEPAQKETIGVTTAALPAHQTDAYQRQVGAAPQYPPYQAYQNYQPQDHGYPTESDATQPLAQQQWQGQGQQPAGEKGSQARTVCGIALPTFILAVLLAIVVIGAGVGGGVGGSLAAKQACSNSNSVAATNNNTIVSVSTTTVTATPASTSSATSTSEYVTVPTYSDVSLALNCPDLDDNERDVTAGGTTYKFTLHCGVDYRGTGVDVVAVTAYSLDDCLRSCASYSYWLGSNGCVAVAFDANMASEVDANYGNCWVKNSTGTTYSFSGDTANRRIGAIMQT